MTPPRGAAGIRPASRTGAPPPQHPRRDGAGPLERARTRGGMRPEKEANTARTRAERRHSRPPPGPAPRAAADRRRPGAGGAAQT
ncbi:hypothetical protein ACFV2G_28700, partial [Streptomyces sp. NPDC059701]